jgi:hypothetical protein
MDKRTKILIPLLIIFFIFSVGAKYYNFVVERNFIVTSEISCDLEIESCFVWDCDMESDPECDYTPYKYISKNAKNVPYCNPYEEGECAELSCDTNEQECEITLCTEETVGEEEYCTE